MRTCTREAEKFNLKVMKNKMHKNIFFLSKPLDEVIHNFKKRKPEKSSYARSYSRYPQETPFFG